MNYRSAKQYFIQMARAKPYFYIAICLAASAVLLDLFVEVTENTLLKSEMVYFDATVIAFIQQFVTPERTKWVLLLTDSGSAQFYLIGGCGLLLYWLIKRRPNKAFILTVCLGGAGLLNFLLKHLFERSRPDIFRVITETGYSFPSGHAMSALCFYGIVAFFLCLRLARLKHKIFFSLFAAFFILLIGLSRIYLGVHYPSDIVAGYLAGSVWLFFCISLYLILTERKKV